MSTTNYRSTIAESQNSDCAIDQPTNPHYRKIDQLIYTYLIEEIRTTPEGNRETTANRNARTIGGMFAAERLNMNREQIAQDIYCAAQDSRLEPHECEKVSTRSFSQGIEAPLYLTVDYKYKFPNLCEISDEWGEFVRKCAEEGAEGDARMLEALFEDLLHFDNSLKKWFLWKGHSWEKDGTWLIYSLLNAIQDQYLSLHALYERQIQELTANTETGSDEEKDTAKNQIRNLEGRQKLLIKKVQNLNSTARGNVIDKHADRFPGISIIGNEWQKNIDLLPVANGVINLRTWDFRPGRPSDLCHTACPTEYCPGGKAPRWEQFISEIFPDPEIAHFIQRLLGYGLMGTCKEHILPILHGSRGRNGKDTLLETLGEVLGPIAGTISTDCFVSQVTKTAGSASPHLVQLQGKRIAWASETQEGSKLNAAQVKMITGGGTINARPLYGDPIEFKPTHLAMLITNNRPQVPSDDDALWSRLILIPFTQRFVDSPGEEYEHLADKRLKWTLQKEASGILNWLLDGCREYQADGLNIPESLKEFTGEYRESQDHFSDFIFECLDLGEGYKTFNPRRVYEVYREWFGDSKRVISEEIFWERMKLRGFSRGKQPERHEGKPQRYWLGFKLKDHILESLENPLGNLKLPLYNN